MTHQPDAGPPTRGTAFSRALARGILGLCGWRIVGTLPAIPQFVAIVAPHTSNWDFPLCIFTMFAIGLRLSWYGKHTLFRFPVRTLLHWFGGEPIDRAHKSGNVASAVARFGMGRAWALGVAPEGTRRRVDQWKLGFYRIAVGAGVPVVPVSLDYAQRLVTIGEPIPMTGDQAADLGRLRARFASRMARFPGQFVDDPFVPG